MARSSFVFQDRTAIITGGAGDIGRAIGRELHQRGMRLVIADIDEVSAQAFADELGERVLVVVADLTKESENARLLKETEAAYGACDVVINNLAITNAERFHERSTASMIKEIEIVMIAPILLSRLAIPLLQNSPDPRIITVTSLAGILPLRETPIYSAARFGLRGAMLSFALDEENHGIHVSCVLPTATDTYMLRQEVLEGGSVLNFIDEPQPISAVVKEVLLQLGKPRLERYPKCSDSLLARLAMVFPNLLGRVLPYFERRGRKGMKNYLQSLHDRGLIEEVEGELRQKARKHLRFSSKFS